MYLWTPCHVSGRGLARRGDWKRRYRPYTDILRTYPRYQTPKVGIYVVYTEYIVYIISDRYLAYIL